MLFQRYFGGRHPEKGRLPFGEPWGKGWGTEDHSFMCSKATHSHSQLRLVCICKYTPVSVQISLILPLPLKWDSIGLHTWSPRLSTGILHCEQLTQPVWEKGVSTEGWPASLPTCLPASHREETFVCPSAAVQHTRLYVKEMREGVASQIYFCACFLN